MAEPKFRTIIGFVKFPPREDTVEKDGDEIPVRNILVRNAGVLDQAIDVRATVWPSHAHIDIDEGDLLALEGKFTPRKGEDKDGNPTTFFNLSVYKIVHLGSGDAGEREAVTTRSSSADADDEDAW